MSPLPSSLLAGTLDLLILKTLSVGTLHGYAIAQHIHRLSNDALRVEEGSLYVSSASRVNSHPFSTNTAELHVDGIDSVEALGRFNFQVISRDYFRVMQARILRGRAIMDADRDGTPRVAFPPNSSGQRWSRRCCSA